jgi:hypothetical protein
MNPVLRTAAWLGALAATLAGLLAGGDRLTPPPLFDPAAAWSWLERTDPATAAFSLLRLAAIAVVGYLLLVTVVLVAAQATRIRVLIAMSTRLTLPAARRLVRHAVGAGVALGMAASTAPMLAGAQTPPTAVGGTGMTVVTPVASDPPPVLQRIGDDLILVHVGPTPDAHPVEPGAGEASAPKPTGTPEGPAPSAGPRRPPPGPMTTAIPTVPLPPSPPSDPTVPPAPAPAPAPASEPTAAAAENDGSEAPAANDTHGTTTAHTIVTGDHLWGISERALVDAWGVVPDPDDVADYLDRLIDRNRFVLAVRDDPDLVFPGQVFTLPPVPVR